MTVTAISSNDSSFKYDASLRSKLTRRRAYHSEAVPKAPEKTYTDSSLDTDE